MQQETKELLTNAAKACGYKIRFTEKPCKGGGATVCERRDGKSWVLWRPDLVIDDALEAALCVGVFEIRVAARTVRARVGLAEGAPWVEASGAASRAFAREITAALARCGAAQ